MSILEQIKTLASDPRRATDVTDVAPARIFPPISETVLDKCEHRLGFKLPRLLRDIYASIGNGGFGPGYGLIGVGPDGAVNEDHKDIVEIYRMYKDGPPDCHTWSWPTSYLPFSYYGCNIYACVECDQESFPVYCFDTNKIDYDSDHPERTAFSLESPALLDWFRNWTLEATQRDT